MDDPRNEQAGFRAQPGQETDDGFEGHGDWSAQASTHGRVELVDDNVAAFFLRPQAARDLAAELIAAADKAESEPMFTEEDIDIIFSACPGLAESTLKLMRKKLRALRKPRES